MHVAVEVVVVTVVRRKVVVPMDVEVGVEIGVATAWCLQDWW